MNREATADALGLQPLAIQGYGTSAKGFQP